MCWLSEKYLTLQARSQGVEEEESPPAQLKKIHFALNREHPFFDATA